ncbi:glutamate receptor 2.5 [Cucumis sativus]|uniref:glutamate receptor 2.5 n=1 Tax=Cucumis sativus TaxID=3659 RepID=UPI0012F5149C|nr:glutamate receptor 2.5 [Cucumis sativus]
MEKHKGYMRGGFRVLAVIVILLNIVIMSVAAQEEEEVATAAVVKVKVGAVLDLNFSFGKMGLSCISMALADFYSSRSRYKTRVILNTIDSNNTVVGAAAAALDLIKKEEVQSIIGPTSSMQASFMIDVGDKAQVPIISFSATRPSLTSHRSSYFFRITQADSFQVKAIAAIVKAFKWRKVVPIYVDNEFGDGIIPFLVDALQEVDANVPYQSVISLTATDDEIELKLSNLMNMQTRVFVVHMLPPLASRLFTVAKKKGMMGRGYVWIVTDAITNEFNSMEPSIFYQSMQGVLGIRTYVPGIKRLESFKRGWQKRFLRYYPTIEEIPELNVFGLWAYDAAWALAIAVEKAGTDNLRYSKPNNVTSTTMKTNHSSNYLYNLGINENGPKLRDALSNVRFRGLAGEFSLVNGQLQSFVFEIVNVVGNERRSVGFWTPKIGLTTSLRHSGRKKELRQIIWPGDTDEAPKGWEIPTGEKKLRVGVPVKDGFLEFVNVVRDPKTNTTEVSGYCIDVFKAVIEALPYAVAYEFIPNDKSNAHPGGSYNELTHQLYLGKFDVVVGDITIRANRSEYIDYTLPFTESGVAMVVPMNSSKNTSVWAFLKPLSWKLWVVIGNSFLLMAGIVWALEHRVNEEFNGSVVNQICNSLWYSFSTMVFAHREPTYNHLTKFVVIIWLFVVLIITQSYTASLASLLTVQELKPTVTDINQLLKNGENVGYQGGSFVYEILKSLKFHDSQLKTYQSLEQMHELFLKGSTNGGISAAVDENPYIKLFLAKYCSQYTTTEPTYKADGFGFGFPVGSPLVPDVSRAILKVTEGDRIREIENAWFKKVKECSSSEAAELSSSRLTIDSLWVLFAITDGVSILLVFCYVVYFVLKELPQSWSAKRPSIWQTWTHLFSRFMATDNEAINRRKRGSCPCHQD